MYRYDIVVLYNIVVKKFNLRPRSRNQQKLMIVRYQWGVQRKQQHLLAVAPRATYFEAGSYRRPRRHYRRATDFMSTALLTNIDCKYSIGPFPGLLCYIWKPLKYQCSYKRLTKRLPLNSFMQPFLSEISLLMYLYT